MFRVRLIHWNTAEAEGKAEKLRTAGCQVAFEPLNGQEGLRRLRNTLPQAFVIDLSRLPSQGRDIALFIRHNKTTRFVPLVFVGGEPEKVRRIQLLLPDATYTSWDHIRRDLKKAIANPPLQPLVPKSVMDGYSGAPLAKKLGLKPNARVWLIHAPKDFEQDLGALPEGLTLHRRRLGDVDLTIWFAISHEELGQRIETVRDATGRGGLWIAWPKKSSKVTTDLSETKVRKAGLAAGLVDYKICSIDNIWSALKFSKRRVHSSSYGE